MAGKSPPNASDEILQARIADAIICLAAFALLDEQAAPLHQPQMSRRHVTDDSATLGQLANRITIGQHYFHHPQAARVGQGAKTLGRMDQGVPFEQASLGSGRNIDFHWRILTNISKYLDMSICP
jgi:hypothetical protein